MYVCLTAKYFQRIELRRINIKRDFGGLLLLSFWEVKNVETRTKTNSLYVVKLWCKNERNDLNTKYFVVELYLLYIRDA